MGVSDCENFRLGYRVIVTLLGCMEFVMLCLDTTWYLLGVEVTMWGPLILTDVVPVGVLCVKLPYSVTMSLGLGGTCGGVTATQLLLLVDRFQVDL